VVELRFGNTHQGAGTVHVHRAVGVAGLQHTPFGDDALFFDLVGRIVRHTRHMGGAEVGHTAGCGLGREGVEQTVLCKLGVKSHAQQTTFVVVQRFEQTDRHHASADVQEQRLFAASGAVHIN
jgi:hypothetical protein